MNRQAKLPRQTIAAAVLAGLAVLAAGTWLQQRVSRKPASSSRSAGSAAHANDGADAREMEWSKLVSTADEIVDRVRWTEVLDAADRLLIVRVIWRLQAALRDAESASPILAAGLHLRLARLNTARGRFAVADDDFRRAADSLQVGDDQFGDDVARLGLAVETRWFRSEWLFDQDQFADATAELEKAVELTGRPDVGSASDRYVALLRARSLSRLGHNQMQEGQAAAAEASLLDALQVLEAVESNGGADPILNAEASAVLDALAALAYADERLPIAKTRFRKLVQRASQALQRESDDVAHADWLILAHHVLADLELSQKNPAAAQQHLVAALAAAERYANRVDESVLRALRRSLESLQSQTPAP